VQLTQLSLTPLFLATLGALLPACGVSPQVGSRAESVVYGTDDRLEVYQVPAGPMRTVAEQAVAIQVAHGVGTDNVQPQIAHHDGF